MPLPTLITDLSKTAGANFPLGGDSPSALDDTQRYHGVFIAQLRDGDHVASATAKTTLVDADIFPMNDSAASNILKKITWANIKAALSTLYQPIGSYLTAGAITGSGLTQATARMLGRSTAGSGAIEEISLGTGLSLSAGVLNTVNTKAPTLSAFITATGTAVSVTSGIPTWINELTINFFGLSTNGSSNILAQLRSSTFVVSGYKSSNSSGSGGVTSNNITNAHFLAGNVAAGATFRGSLTFRRHPGNVWIGTSMLSSESSSGFYIGTSEVTLVGDLDGFRITMANGTDTFDAGEISYIYRE